MLHNCFFLRKRLKEAYILLVIESGLGDAKGIKTHHNVGGRPDVVDFRDLIEPLRDLFKDEVFGLCFSTEDQKEGMAAFVEKRKAKFTDR